MSTTAKLQIKDQKVAVLNPPPGLDLDVPTAEHPDDAVLLFVRTRRSSRPLGSRSSTPLVTIGSRGSPTRRPDSSTPT
jgi:hypothetical protein